MGGAPMSPPEGAGAPSSRALRSMDQASDLRLLRGVIKVYRGSGVGGLLVRKRAGESFPGGADCRQLPVAGGPRGPPAERAWLRFQGAISGRSRWSNMEKVCTSVNLSKACRKQEDLGEGAQGRGGAGARGWGARRDGGAPSLA